MAQAGDAASPGHQGHASCHCGCHPDFGDPADATLSVRWRCSRAMTPAAEQAFVSRSPEALPEPPRSFA